MCIARFVAIYCIVGSCENYLESHICSVFAVHCDLVYFAVYAHANHDYRKKYAQTNSDQIRRMI